MKNNSLDTPVATTPTLPPSPAAATAAVVEHDPFQTTWGTRLTILGGVLIPLLAVIAAIILLWGVAFSWIYLALLGGMYLASAIGITVGYHRYFTHKSFEAPRFVVFILAALGGMAAEGSVLEWTAVHRRHHQHSDDHDDPHSPNSHGRGFFGTIRGLWHAHIGWMFECRPAGLIRYVGDLRKDRMIRIVSTLFPLWVLIGMLVPAVLGGVLTLTWMGVLLGFIWGGLVRVFLVHHVTWSINSVCHVWGTRPFDSHDKSRNNLLFGILGMGEGWHNNHHAFPTSARHGLHWWQFDASYLFIRCLGLVGLASNIRVPAREVVLAKRRG